MLEFGTTRVELGVQTLDDEIHRLTKRGHGVAEVISATKLLRDYGFKVYYHWMPGLPGSTPEHDMELSQKLFDDEYCRPDGLKLYPTLVVTGSELESWYHDNRYQPYEDEQMIDLLANIKSLLPKYVRVPRLMRDIPSKFIIAGCSDLALRETVKKRMRELNLRCQCTRCREYGHRLRDGWLVGEPRLTRLEYDASHGKEIFLCYEDENETLFGLLRLRVSPNLHNDNEALIRELHIFGAEVPLGEKKEQAAQHQGLGKELLLEAERITATEFHIKKLAILSGVGVRDYYRSLGYHSEGNYMVKRLI